MDESRDGFGGQGDVARKRRGEKQERSTSPGKLRMILDRLIRVKIPSMEMGEIQSLKVG